MGQFFLTILLLCVSSILVSGKEGSVDLMPEASFFPTVDQEIAQLSKGDMAFSDFCLSARNSIFFDIRDQPADFATKLVKYGRGMSPDSRILLERASMKLFRQLENPNVDVDDLFANYQYDSIIEEGIERIKQSKGFSESYMIALNYIWQVYSAYSIDTMAKKLKEAKSMKEMEMIYENNHRDRTDMVGYVEEIREQSKTALSELESKNHTVVKAEFNATKGACSKFNDYQNELKKVFNSMKAKIVSSDASLARVSLDNVGCLTTRRVLNAVAVCGIIDLVKEPLSRFLSKGDKE